MKNDQTARITKRLSSTLLALLLAFGAYGAATVAAAPPAAAESSSAYSPQYPWPHNGCTIAPDAPSGISFTYACNHHDGCYAGHWASKVTCDLWFYKDMSIACATAWWAPQVMRTACLEAATIYYGFVVARGQPYYDSKGQQVRINTPLGNIA
ncbi:MAG: phospholipase A2 [Pseudarthrobacter sp.]